MDTKSIQYLKQYIEVSDVLIEKIIRHAARYQILPKICAWYKDWDDFCSDWCDDHGYTKTQARKLLHGGIGEFMILPDELGIIRFAM